MSTTATSLPAAERIPTLDILRGFALMGILIMNMPGFSASFFVEADGSRLWVERYDQIAEGAREALFSGKFNSMFSLLFGIGFTIQYARMQERDPRHATELYLRRLIALLAFGVVHAWVFWPGDVLHVYALLGIVLVLGLRRLGDRGIVVLIVAGLLYPAVNGLVRLAVITKEITAERVRLAQGFEATNNAAFGAGGFLDMVRENTRMMNFFYGDALNLWSQAGWMVMLGMTMLIGVLAGRRRWVQRAAELMPQIRRLTWWSLVVGLACGAAFAVIFDIHRDPGPSPIKLLGSICYSLSRLALMVFYVLLIVRIAQSARGRRWLAPWAAAGRMPLTNYLMQTAICLVLFQHWGLGWWLQVGPALGLVLSLAIFFAVQVPWSLWWLKRHERGPMEALWARLTYGGAPARAAAARPLKAP
ncbi:MAG: DUF418 domain-containing protein [Burkholderiaceae bacterium]|jgi:uncharacterized protein|nr:DUF418 domain-containing protein [Burkholderiaceae bacterium]